MKKYISTSEAAKTSGISTVAASKKIQSGVLPTHKIERKTEKRITEAVKRVISEYGETLKKLGKD